jgi:protein-disulfide isomerase
MDENISPHLVESQSDSPRRPWILSLLIPGLVALAFFGAGLGTGWYVWGRPTPEPTAQIQIPENLIRYDVDLDDDPSLGPADAPITIVEFSDYQCPFCTRWHDQVFKKLMDEYDGQIRFIYRDFPLKSIHPEAVPAAEAANCAFEQDAFWGFHDALFKAEFGLGVEAYEQYARGLGLDMEKFTACVAERRYADDVESDFIYASEFGISSTPTFFVNGIPIVGAQPYDVFKQVIDLELAGKLPK